MNTILQHRELPVMTFLQLPEVQERKKEQQLMMGLHIQTH